VFSPTIIYDLVTIYHTPHVIPNSTFDSKDIPFLGSIHLDTALNLVVGLFSQYFVSYEQFQNTFGLTYFKLFNLIKYKLGQINFLTLSFIYLFIYFLSCMRKMTLPNELITLV
jgi:hypothetical protein